MEFDGVVLINKNKQKTSFDYVAKLKKLFKTKKIGHTGTLDIDARGLLVCLIGRACKLQDYFLNTNKEYVAELICGVSTDTEDITGSIIKKNTGLDITDEQIENAIKSFIGKYMQTPPMYSSKKINGQKLLYLAKEGKEVDRKPCEVNIYNIEVLNLYEMMYYQKKYNLFNEDYKHIEKENNIKIKKIYLKINCSKGTYIRTLCKDIGKKLNINSCMGELFRTKTSGFDIQDSLSIEDVENKINNGDYSFVKPALYLNEEQITTFGKYETLHLGHQKIINEMVNKSKEYKYKTSVLIVDDDKDKYLTDEQKLSIIKNYGINNVLYFPYNEWTKNYDGEYFVKEILVNQMKSKIIIVGEDCSFGKNAMYKSQQLIEICNKYNIKVFVIEKMKLCEVYDYYKNSNAYKYLDDNKKNILENIKNDNTEISSTLIKKLKEENKNDEISLLLKRNII